MANEPNLFTLAGTGNRRSGTRTGEGGESGQPGSRFGRALPSAIHERVSHGKSGMGPCLLAGPGRTDGDEHRFHDFVLRTPYFAQIAASDLAGRILATLESTDSGKRAAAQLGTSQDRLTLLFGHDSNLAWLGGLLRLDWLVPTRPSRRLPRETL